MQGPSVVVTERTVAIVNLPDVSHIESPAEARNALVSAALDALANVALQAAARAAEKTSEQVAMPCRTREGGEPSCSRGAESPQSATLPAFESAVGTGPGEIRPVVPAEPTAATRGIETRREPAGDTAGVFGDTCPFCGETAYMLVIRRKPHLKTGRWSCAACDRQGRVDGDRFIEQPTKKGAG